MALLLRVDAAMRLGVSLELLDWFTTTSPKNDGTILKFKIVDGDKYFDDAELIAFQKYLHSPWPLSPKGKRPHIPKAMKDDVRAECHHCCAVCGDMNGGEVAHIDAVSTTLNNGPDNLLLLCPNHHTQYDFGYQPKNNVTRDVVVAAKALKRNTRRRLMKVEANTTKYLTGIVSLVRQLENKLATAQISKEEAAVCTSELKTLLQAIPATSQKLQELGAADQDAENTGKLLTQKAPVLAKFAAGPMPQESSVRAAARSVVEAVRAALVELDEEECPHCAGRGQTGLIGDLCSFCRGSCFVSRAEAEAYDPAALDEADCPHCGARGQTGLIGDLCAVCKGSCVVPRSVAENYDSGDVDEVDCPHCSGRGQTGLAGDLCAFCRGSCVVSRRKASEYDLADIDEIDCPHCRGRGQTGIADDTCAFCKGSCVVSRRKASQYDAADIDEVDCPHCSGRGQTGLVGDVCVYCHGSCVVSQSEAEAYDPDQIDESECPRCRGQGTTGVAGDICKLCRGATVVRRAVAAEYERKYGR